MIVDTDLTSFTSGEISPLLKGRIDLSKYYNGCEQMDGFTPLPQGGATRDPGSMFIQLAKDQTRACRMIPFVFSTIQAYQIELSHLKARFYAVDAPVLSGGSPVEIDTPYTADQLAALDYTQSDDTLFLFHPSVPTQALTRTSVTSFSIGPVTFRDGPYLPVNTTDTTLTASGTTGTVTINASATTGINATASNPGQGFLASDVGRMLRMRAPTNWAWLLIQAWHSTTEIVAEVRPAVPNGAAAQLDGTSATAAWQLGKWGSARGYPSCGAFFQNRLVLCGSTSQPNAIEGSVIGDFTNFAPSAADESVTQINALSWIIDDDQVNAIEWISPAGSAQAAQLGIGTRGGEQILQPATNTQALSPTNVQAYRETAFGSAPNVRPMRIAKSVLFADGSGRKVWEWTFNWQVNGYLAPDLTVLSEHITRPAGGGQGIVQFAYQQRPYSIVWAILADGTLIGLTYLRDQDVVAWHRRVPGGNYYGGPPIVESIACIPAPDASYDELWLQVLRTIDGTPKRTVEVMAPWFDGRPAEEAWYVDCGLGNVLTRPAADLTLTGFGNLNPATKRPAFGGDGNVSASASIFGSGNVGSLVRVNGGLLRITAVQSGTAATAKAQLPMRNLAPAAQGSWTMDPLRTSFSNLAHLAGEQVSVWGDGQDFGRVTVANDGTISLPAPGASYAIAGLPMRSTLVTVPFAPVRAAAASVSGRVKRIDTLFLRLHETIGGDAGMRLLDPGTYVETDKTETLSSRSAADPLNQGPPLFSGPRRIKPPGGFDQEGRVIITQDGPAPMTVLAISARADVGDTSVGG